MFSSPWKTKVQCQLVQENSKQIAVERQESNDIEKQSNQRIA